MTIDEIRALLGLGSDVSDADVLTAYDAYLLTAPANTNATVAEFRIRYPAFAAVLDDTVAYWLTDSLRIVTADWGSDAIPAQMAFAAHEMSIGGVAGVVKSESEEIPAGVTRFRSGQMDVTVTEAAANRSAAGGYASTRYGRDFAVYLRRHRGGPRLVGCA